jgi:hypothetical protein
MTDDEDDVPRIPMNVLIACIIWMSFGVFVLVSHGAFFFFTGDGLNLASLIIFPLLSSTFILMAFMTLIGRVSRLYRNGFGSMFIGMLIILIGLFFLIMGLGHHDPGSSLFCLGVGFVIFLIGVALIVAGYLAIRSRVAYVIWQQFRKI